MHKPSTLFALLSLTRLVCAAAPEGQPSKPLTVDLGRVEVSAEWQAVGAQFLSATGLPVRFSSSPQLPLHTPDKLPDSDIICVRHDELPYLVIHGDVLPVNPTPRTISQTVMIAWDAISSGGVKLAYPLAISADMLIYNPNLVPEPPENFEELDSIDRELRSQAEVRAIDWDYGNGYLAWSLTGGRGGVNVIARESGPSGDTLSNGLNQAEVLTGIEFLKGMVDSGLLPAQSDYVRSTQQMQKGQLAMTIDGPWAWKGLQDAGIPFKVAPVPALAVRKSRSLVEVWGCAVRAGERQKQAERFLQDYVLQDANLKALFESYSIAGVPSHKATFKHMYAQENIRSLIAVVNQGKPGPNMVKNRRFWAELGIAIRAIVAGGNGEVIMHKAWAQVQQP